MEVVRRRWVFRQLLALSFRSAMLMGIALMTRFFFSFLNPFGLPPKVRLIYLEFRFQGIEGEFSIHGDKPRVKC